MTRKQRFLPLLHGGGMLPCRCSGLPISPPSSSSADSFISTWLLSPSVCRATLKRVYDIGSPPNCVERQSCDGSLLHQPTVLAASCTYAPTQIQLVHLKLLQCSLSIWLSISQVGCFEQTVRLRPTQGLQSLFSICLPYTSSQPHWSESSLEGTIDQDRGKRRQPLHGCAFEPHPL